VNAAERKELYLAYAQNFWNVSNSIVTLMFALTFAVYLATIQFAEARRLISKFYVHLLVLATVSHILLFIVMLRLRQQELAIVSLLTPDEVLKDAIRIAFRVRVEFFVFNFLMYIGVLTFIRRKVGRVVGLTSDFPKQTTNAM